MFKIAFLNNRKGMSLIEVLIAAGLMVIVASGMVGVVTSMNKEQNNQTRISTLRELKTRFQFLITDQNSWNQTLAQNATAGNALAVCLRDKTTCSAAGITNLTLYDSAGTAVFVPPPFNTTPAAAGSNGYTDKGTPCAAFNGTTGVDACPISYKVVWEPVCTGTCKNPLVKVTVRMMFKASNNAQITAFSVGNSDHTTSWTDDTVAANVGKYDVVIKRSASSISKSFKLTISSTAAATGGGACATDPAVSVRGDTTAGTPGPAWDAEAAGDDPFDLVQTVGTDGTIRIAPGTYSCKITALGWAVDSFKVQLNKLVAPNNGVVAGSVGSSNASSTSFMQSTASSSPVVSVSEAAGATFKIEQSCSNPNYVLPGAYKYNMGMPASPYTKSTLATFTCTQTN